SRANLRNTGAVVASLMGCPNPRRGLNCPSHHIGKAQAERTAGGTPVEVREGVSFVPELILWQPSGKPKGPKVKDWEPDTSSARSPRASGRRGRTRLARTRRAPAQSVRPTSQPGAA